MRWSAAHALDALAHVDVDFVNGDGGVMRAAPPVLAVLPTPGIARAILCGSRSPAAIAEVAAFTRRLGLETVVRPPSLPLGTAVIEIQATSRGRIEQVAGSLGVAYAYPPPALGLLAASGDVDEYLHGLTWIRAAELAWPRVDFDASAHQFRPGAVAGSLRLARYVDPVRGTPRYHLWRGDEYALVDPRWARFAVLRAHGESAVEYDSSKFSVRVPRSTPLPRLLARALVLCTGELPMVVRSEHGAIRAFDSYGGVPPDLFSMLQRRLGAGEARAS